MAAPFWRIAHQIPSHGSENLIHRFANGAKRVLLGNAFLQRT